MNKQQGFGLPEVMISLLLASLTISALMNHYMGAKQHYIRLQATMDKAIELQWVADFMRDSIHQAGFTPCLRLDYLETLDQRDGHTPLLVVEEGSGLIVHRMSPRFDMLLDRLNATQILLTRNQTVPLDRPIVISDCFHAEVHRVLSVTKTADKQILTLANPLAFTYESPAYVGEWLQERFFIKSPKGLFYQRTHPEELTAQVKSMSLTLKNNVVNAYFELKGGDAFVLDARIRAS